jgi:hypothetical protein
MFVGLRESTIRSQTGHIQIQKNGYKTYGGSAPTEYLILNYEEILEEVYADPELEALIKLDMKELTYNGVLTASAGERQHPHLLPAIVLQVLLRPLSHQTHLFVAENQEYKYQIQK